MTPEHNLSSLKSKIDNLQIAYFVLFGTSLLLLIGRWTVGLPAISQLFWALTLGGAVLVRLYRVSLVNKYNSALAGRPGPIQ